jgi:hypothetical protein
VKIKPKQKAAIIQAIAIRIMGTKKWEKLLPADSHFLLRTKNAETITSPTEIISQTMAEKGMQLAAPLRLSRVLIILKIQCPAAVKGEKPKTKSAVKKLSGIP